jgi:hypothetical protein
MALLLRIGAVAGYSFAAWLFAALLIYATAARLPAPWSVPARCAGLLATFGPVFSLYFRRARPLAPAAAALVAVGFLALLDLALVARHLPHAYDLYLRFWDWQLPAACAAGAIYAAGTRERLAADAAAQAALKK